MPSSTETISAQADRKVLVLFGPQRSTIRGEGVTELASAILQTPGLEFLLDELKTLKELWKGIVAGCPELSTVPGGEALSQLWLLFSGRSAAAELQQAPARSIILNIITVLSQVLDLWHHATTDLRLDSIPTGEVIKGGGRVSDVQGFCIGFLTAAAVASSGSQQALKRNIAVALRLAVCVGALIDLDTIVSSPAVSISVDWKSESQSEELRRIIDGFTEAYISCVTDQTRVTVTLRPQDLTQLLKQVSSAGLASQVIALQGRFHRQEIHNKVVNNVQQLCRQDKRFQLPDAVDLIFPLRSSINATPISRGALHDEAIRSILQEQCQWYQTVQEAVAASAKGPDFIISVGSEMAIPRTIMKTKQAKASGLLNGIPASASTDSSSPLKTLGGIDSEIAPAIAIIGMASRYPDSDTVEDFWDLVQSGRSAVQPLPENRFRASQLQREPKGPFWGNFLRHPEHFDHRFFGISGREAKSMDPQQRLALEVTYEALESAGYFGLRSCGKEQLSEVGVYLGVGSVDYGDNVGSHNANAFSALGTLRAFISGRLSHYFGWSGPSITYDTACSSGLVAIHAAANALRANECAMALAGGVNVITSPALYQNLAAASFLSPTGASKAFDERADGYCRGEGVGVLVLKTLSRAQKDGDSILAVIRGSAVMQGSNRTPIAVPSPDTQAALYRKALAMSGVEASDVTYVEAHGTGTRVGDPIECNSIREVFGGPRRNTRLFVGSVKDNVGHTESASGATAMIKTVLMMQKNIIPRQANFIKLNPKIAPLSPDCMEIPQQSQPWLAERRIAVVNNYGAAGSNVAMVLEQHKTRSTTRRISSLTSASWPFFISAQSVESLLAYSSSLAASLNNIQNDFGDGATMTLSYNLAMKQNRQLEYARILSASSLPELVTSLTSASVEDVHNMAQQKRPVVLCIGGQNGITVYVDSHLYYGSSLFRHHLDDCDSACLELGLPTIFPDIFRSEPINDLVKLHCMLFSVQYASARSWIDSGLKVDTIIGHSFGQLTALAVADAVSLHDGLRLISKRAQLIQDAWGDETGAMLSAQASLDTIANLIGEVEQSIPLAVDIACVNGPKSVVLAGDSSSMALVEQRLRKEGIKTTHLANTHAFHSRLVEPILPRWRDVVQACHFQQPSIKIEACADNEYWSSSNLQEYVVQHSRKPVLFYQAVTRVAALLKHCLWVEAGSSSPVISLVRNCLNTEKSRDILQALDLRGPDATSMLSRAICNLWAADAKVQHWCFQQDESHWINLPPYKFEKSSHWLDYVPLAASSTTPSTSSQTVSAKTPRELLEVVTKGAQGFDLQVNYSHPMFTYCVEGHAVLGQPLCPASMYVELVTEAVDRLRQLNASAGVEVRGLKILSPLSIGARTILIRLSQIPDERNTWEFTIVSRPGADELGPLTTHTTGVVSINNSNSTLPAKKLHSLRRLADPMKVSSLSCSADSNILQGKNIYRSFRQVVNYAAYYQGVKRIVSKDNESVGSVHLPHGQTPGFHTTRVDPVLLDNFLQVAGIHVNCLSDRTDEEVYICTQLDELAMTDSFTSRWREIPTWTVYSTFERTSDKTLSNDILVYDAESGELMVMFIGATFRSTSMNSLAKILSKLNTNAQDAPLVASNRAIHGSTQAPPDSPGFISTTPASQLIAGTNQHESVVSVGKSVMKVRELLSSILEIPISEILGESILVEIGIDSLLSAEILTEISKHFAITISPSNFNSLKTVSSIAQYIDQNKSSTTANDQTASSAPVLNGTNRPSLALLQVQKMFSDLLEIPTSEIKATSSLNDIGIDSLLATEVLSEIRTRFTVTTSTEQLQGFKDVAALAEYLQPRSLTDEVHETPTEQSIDEPVCDMQPLASIAKEEFRTARQVVDEILPVTGFSGFSSNVLPLQKQLVVAYVVEAFDDLGCSLRALHPGQRLPDVTMLPQHNKVKSQIYHILEDADLICLDSRGHLVRTMTPVPQAGSEQLLTTILSRFPQHAYEHKLLASTGTKLAQCLTGRLDPLGILFGSADARSLMENVYTNAPMFKTGTIVLARYLEEVFAKLDHQHHQIKILELGAGTGGTTKHLIEHLLKISAGQPFEYTFSDISPSLVAAARKKFAHYSFVQYALVNIEQDPPTELLDHYDLVISTNCIHATKNLVASCSNIRKLLHSDGLLCLIELTRNLFWFDLVFGLLDGWWRFEDGRHHALANENLWRKYLARSGFRWIDWTVGKSEESNILRLITASMSEPLVLTETVEFDKVDGVRLEADIYYPDDIVTREGALPVALMIHGGGHIMLSRKDIRPAQTQMLLDRGFLPVSIDYRLCPETTLPNGPMYDACTALSWARTVLPTIPLRRSDVRIDPNRVVAVGWSTGGHLAMTLGFTAPQRGIRPPDAILAFYCPLDYEDSFWRQPNFPFGRQPDPSKQAEIHQTGLYDYPITAYNPPTHRKALGGWMDPQDARSNIALNMNWKGLALHVILNGLSESDYYESLPAPSKTQVQSISPLAQIVNGMYSTPTFIIHGTKDDLVPVSQAVRTYCALQEYGVTSELRILDDAIHLFDLGKIKGDWATAVEEGYNFLQREVFSPKSEGLGS
ncbi:hypothetical protein BJY04DRAFT_217168 [Aspergillus karnatakaensis]|uniref:uncharacterized protein n=1 Tax=Aspergillus karnatakaensis TaxID=1810916 RepID=UPI003CCDAFA3